MIAVIIPLNLTKMSPKKTAARFLSLRLIEIIGYLSYILTLIVDPILDAKGLEDIFHASILCQLDLLRVPLSLLFVLF
jgi:hypothetical protein